MPVRKYTDPSQMDEACWRDPDDPALWRDIATLWRFARRVAPCALPPGVYKCRSIGEANERARHWARHKTP